MKDVEELVEQSTQCVSCNAALTFSDEDLLLGSKPHNRPLYVSGYIRGQKVNRILIDRGSRVNLMPKATMKELGITVDEISNSRTVIHGFNLNGERAIGMIRFFEENGTSSEFMPTTISSTGKGGKLKENTKEHVVTSHIKENDKQDIDNASKASTPVTSPKKQEMPQKSTSPVLRYIPKSRRKEGDSPFVKCLTNRDLKDKSKPSPMIKQQWMAKVTTPLPSSNQMKVMRPPPVGFICSANQSSSDQNVGIFDSNAYKLLTKAGYDFTKPTLLGKVVEVEPYGLNKTQHELFKQEGSFIETKAGLGYKFPTPVKISARRNRTTTSSQHITVEEAEENEAKDIKTLSTSSVFDRIRSSNNDSGKTLLCSTSVEENDEEVNITDDLRSAIPSRMKQSKPPYSHSRDAKDLEIVTSYHITAEEIPDDSEEVEADKAPEKLEDEVQSTVDDLKELNLGTDEDPRPIYVSALLTKEEEEEYYKLLVEYKDVFAWIYKEMPGLSPKIAVHLLAIRKGISPRKQSQRHFRTELIPEIENKVNKLIEAGFIRKVRYPTWIPNIVSVRKKNGQLRVCVDFRDLNDACPKDDFPLLVTKLMIDVTTGHEALSFMDCTAGYNQIQMAPEDQEATAFRTPKGIFCYIVMPFGLKNAGATYQRAMQKIFDEMLHKTIECYVDDVVVKSKKRKDHVKDLQTVFERLRKCQLKMNSLKCAFGVTSGKFLGFVYDLVFVSQKAVKGQVIADFFADHPVPTEWEISDELPGEEIFYVDILPPWQMYFNGAARRDGAGAGVVFISPQNHVMPYSFTLTQFCSNNVAEYQALILGLQMAIEIGVRDMDIYEDSQLVISQVLDEYEVRKEDLIPYHRQALQLLNQLDSINIGHVPRSANKLADALSNLAATLVLGAEESMQVPVCNRWAIPLLEAVEDIDTTNIICVYTADEDDWRQPIINFLDHQNYLMIPGTR
ncbi:uncharacterized protein LOC141627548 [Silene latifolia]|uniref:uncharacterized protein LOC141627548 n=1 Tax=Silene latifolia TaxID=37657 RepID=UPI003D779CD8